MKKRLLFTMLVGLLLPFVAMAGEADLEVPDLTTATFFGGAINGWQLLLYGMVIVFLGLFFGYYQYTKIKKLPAHKSMLEVSSIIYDEPGFPFDYGFL